MKEWEKTARKLPCGKSVRVRCCSKDLSRLISHTEHGYSTVCFRCGLHLKQFTPHGVRSISEVLQHKRELEKYIAQAGRVELPEDYTTDIPSVGRAWMLKAGVTSDVTDYYEIGWSDKLGRVVIPIIDDEGEVAGVQSRAVYAEQKPKYLNKTGKEYSSVLFWSDDEIMLMDPLPDWVVLTEDILSAIRVGRIQSAVSSLGTSINHHTVASILELHERVLVWYDGDAAGKRGASNARKKFALQGADVRVISTPKDPKAYSNEEIFKIIEEHTK